MSTKYKLFVSIAMSILVICLFIVAWASTIYIPHPARIDPQNKALSIEVSLQSYCETGLKQNEPSCMTWAQSIMDSQFQSAEKCYSAFDWLTFSGMFGNCLHAEGITSSNK
jgi:hypothetical protein